MLITIGKEEIKHMGMFHDAIVNLSKKMNLMQDDPRFMAAHDNFMDWANGVKEDLGIK